MGIISNYFEYLSFIPLITLVILFLIYREKRINSILSCWADKEGVEIIRRSSGFFRASPFFFTLGHQEVFYLQVRDREGRERACWVRLGDFLFGVLFDRSVEAKWAKSDPSDSTAISGDSHALD
jgi:hypothetical protein